MGPKEHQVENVLAVCYRLTLHDPSRGAVAQLGEHPDSIGGSQVVQFSYLWYLVDLFFVYILQSKETYRYYIGSTKDIQRRLFQHNAGMMKSTRGLRPWRLVHSETFDTLAQARRRETQIKAWKNPRYMEKALGLLS